jgi:hypothetical protein
MAKSFSFSGTFSKAMKKNDVFLLGLLIASLALNVYLGWNLKRLKSASAEPQDSVQLLPGMTVQPITAMSLSGKQETIGYADYDKPTVFYIFSPACSWCERNTQNINTIADLKGESFRFIGLSLGDDNLPGYVESHHLGFPIYKGLTPESIQILRLAGTPQTIVVSPDGLVLKNWIGAFGPHVQPEVEEFFNVRLPGLAAQQN